MRLLFALCLCLSAAADAAPFVVEPWPLPPRTAAAQPDLALAPDGSLLLSWIETVQSGGATHALRLARFDDGAWTEPAEIARGKDFFVNWADVPHVIALRDGSTWAHWLRRNGGGVYDYGIALTRSDDGGRTWAAPLRVEPAGARLDYGFVSFWQHDDALGIAWLDARQKTPPASGHDTPAHDAHSDDGAMMLRAATFAKDGTRGEEWPLDMSTCDCCPTAVATSSKGPLLVYRGRSADEIRDIRIVRHADGRWSEPASVHDDGWRMPGCPVNGPAVAARGSRVAVAWYTEAGGGPRVRLAWSDDAGARFAPPADIAHGDQVLGRVALAVDLARVWLAWLEAGNDQGQVLQLAAFDTGTGREHARMQVATLRGRGSATGLPRLQATDGVAHLVWTDVQEGAPVLAAIRARPAD